MMTTHDDAMTGGWRIGQMPHILSLVSGQGGVGEGMPKSDDPGVWSLVLTPILSVAASGEVVQWTAITSSECKNGQQCV